MHSFNYILYKFTVPVIAGSAVYSSVRKNGSLDYKCTRAQLSRDGRVMLHVPLPNTDIHPVLHHFQVIVQYWSYFHFQVGVPLFNALLLNNL